MERRPPAPDQSAGALAVRRAAEREARLAAALRANLRRRKAQSRARQDTAAGEDEPRDCGPPPAGADDSNRT